MPKNYIEPLYKKNIEMFESENRGWKQNLSHATNKENRDSRFRKPRYKFPNTRNPKSQIVNQKLNGWKHLGQIVLLLSYIIFLCLWKTYMMGQLFRFIINFFALKREIQVF